MEPLSIYIHIPFCRHRCGYCDFNTYAGVERRIPDYIAALCVEIQKMAGAGGDGQPVHTVFFGGGTPSLVPVEHLRKVWQVIHQHFCLLPGLEATLEANPGTVSPVYLAELREMGFNRISFGMQTANPQELRLLERQHSPEDVSEAVAWSRQAGFDNLSLDLIYGLPGQSLASWQASVEAALQLAPEHLSFYSLAIEEGTPLYHQRQQGVIPEPDGDLAADMVEWARDRLAAAGFNHYEISNWARCASDGSLLSSRHNLQYWRDLHYFGFGAGAHGYLGHTRTANLCGIGEYIQACQAKLADFPIGPAVDQAWRLSEREEMQEMMMVGLRLIEDGVAYQTFADRFGKDLMDVFNKPVQKLIRQGLLEDTGTQLRLSQRGWLLGNRVFREFVGD